MEAAEQAIEERVLEAIKKHKRGIKNTDVIVLPTYAKTPNHTEDINHWYMVYLDDRDDDGEYYVTGHMIEWFDDMCPVTNACEAIAQIANEDRKWGHAYQWCIEDVDRP